MKRKAKALFHQSGVIPFRIVKRRVEVLLVTSRKGKRWVIPKGLVEKHLSPPESAVKEAWEEAGVCGSLYHESIGQYRYSKWGGTCQVDVFLLEVDDVAADWPEAELRTRHWFPLEAASERVQIRKLQSLLKTAGEQIVELYQQAHVGSRR